MLNRCELCNQSREAGPGWIPGGRAGELGMAYGQGLRNQAVGLSDRVDLLGKRIQRRVGSDHHLESGRILM